jgi:DNA-binding HxlR family transcriptional regulator
MSALDLFGRRWSLRVLWELRDGPVGARALVERCSGVSTSVLYERLRELADVGLVTRDDVGAYALTQLGTELGSALAPLEAWAERWARVTGS